MLYISFLLYPEGIVAETETFNYNLGPGVLEVASQSPAQSTRFTPVPSVPGKRTPGSWQIRLGSSWANVWTRGSRYDMDYEILHSRLSASYGVTNKFSLLFAIEQRDYFGGAMDGFLEGFHNLFGIEQDGRDMVPHNKAHIFFRDSAGNTTMDSTEVDKIDNNNIQIAASYILTTGSHIFPAVNISGTICRALNSPLKGSGEPLDLSIGIGISKRWTAKIYTYHNLTYTYFGQNEIPKYTMSSNGFSMINAIAMQITPQVSLFIQAMYSKGLIEDIPGLKEPSHETHTGLKWRMKKLGFLEFALIENIITYDNSPDFGIHLAYTYDYM